LDLDTRRLAFAAAGQPGPFLGDASGAVTPLDTRGKFLGVSPRSTYETRTVALPDAGFLFVYSDALSDAASPEGGLVSEAGVGRRCEAAAADAVRGARLAALLAAVESDQLDIVDDLTAVWIDWS